jgi:hypothetical protein
MSSIQFEQIDIIGNNDISKCKEYSIHETENLFRKRKLKATLMKDKHFSKNNSCKRFIIECPACHQPMAIHQKNKRIALMQHFRDVCMNRGLWIKDVLPSLSPLLLVFLGIYAFPISSSTNKTATTFHEVGQILLSNPRWSSSSQKISFPKSILSKMNVSWSMLCEWDHLYHQSIAWFTSGHRITLRGVYMLLYSESYGAALSQEPQFCNLSDKFSCIQRPSVASFHSKAWMSKVDVWSRINRKRELYIRNTYNQYMKDQKISEETQRSIVWTSSDSHANGSQSIGNLNTWHVKHFMDRIEFSPTSPHMNSVFGSSPQEKKKKATRNETEPQHFYYIYPQRNPEWTVYDCLSIEWLSIEPLSTQLICRITQSFRYAYYGFLAIHNLLTSQLRNYETAHKVYLSQCKRYILLQSDLRDSIMWSIAMQYDFLCWWMCMDSFVKEFFIRDQQRKSTRISVPFMIPTPHGICPYCYRFEKIDYRDHPRRLVIDVIKNCLVNTPDHLHDLLNHQFTLFSDYIDSDLLVDSAKENTVIPSAIYDNTQSISKIIKQWLKALYVNNFNILSLSHAKSQHQLSQISFHEFYNELNRRQNLCSCLSGAYTHVSLDAHESKSSHDSLNAHESKSSEIKQTKQVYHNWVVSHLTYHTIEFEYNYGGRQKCINHLFFLLHCPHHSTNFVVHVSLLMGHVSFYHLWDLALDCSFSSFSCSSISTSCNNSNKKEQDHQWKPCQIWSDLSPPCMERLFYTSLLDSLVK